MSFTYDYEMPSVACDSVVMHGVNGDVQVLLIQRKKDPHKGCWALPGGFLNPNETAEEGAARELKEETGITSSYTKNDWIGVYSGPARDPRGRVISIAFFSAQSPETQAVAADDAAAVSWVNIGDILCGKVPVAFDHLEIISDAIVKFSPSLALLQGLK